MSRNEDYNIMPDDDEFEDDVITLGPDDVTVLGSDSFTMFGDDDDEDFVMPDGINFQVGYSDEEEEMIYGDLYDQLHTSELDETFGENLLLSTSNQDEDYFEEGEGTSLISYDQQNSTALSLYVVHNESELVRDRSKRFLRLWQTAKQESTYLERLTDALYKFLEGPECKAIPGKILMFQSKKYKNDGYFHIFLVNRLLALLQTIGDNFFIDSDLSTLYEAVDDILRVEKCAFPPERIMEMRIAISKFAKYFETLVQTYYRRQADPIDMVAHLDISAPSKVWKFGYQCVCETFVPMEDMVPLAVLIVKRHGKYDYMMYNMPVQCPECKRYLAIPEHVVVILEPLIVDLIKRLEVSIKNFVIYRPPVSEIEGIIPSDLQSIFDFSEFDTVVDVTQTTATRSEYASTYISMVDYWMRGLTKKTEVVDSGVVVANAETPQVLWLSHRIENPFDSLGVEYDLVTDLYAMSKTIIHYLENLGCFALTHRGKAFYEFCEMKGFQRYSFTTEEAMAWMRENAWVLAGVKSVVSTSAGIQDDLDLLPEFVPLFNYIFMLRTLAKSENTIKQSYYSAWKNHPHTVESTDFTARLIKASRTKGAVTILSASTRDFKDKTYSFSANAFVGVFELIDEICAKTEIDMNRVSDSVAELIGQVAFETAEEFYNISGEEASKKYLVKPVYRFADFKKAFNELGWNLFVSAGSEMKVVERAKVLTLMLQQDKISKTFEPALTPRVNKKALLVAKSVPEGHHQKMLKEIILLSDDNLPEDFIQVRENSRKEEYLNWYESNREALEEDGRLREMYPEVFK